MGWEELFSVILLLILTAALAVDFPGDRDLCGLLQKRRTTHKAALGNLKANNSTSAILTLSYYYFGLS